MREYYVVYDMTPMERGEGFVQIGIAPQKDARLFGDEHYSSTSETEDNLRPQFINLDTSRHISWRPDDGGDADLPIDDDDDTSGTGDDDGTSPTNDDDEATKQFIEDNKVLFIVGASAAVFLLISLLTCCCCCSKKNRKDTYIYRTYSQLKGSNDQVTALDEDDSGANNRIQ